MAEVEATKETPSRIVKITSLGGADHWQHPVTARAYGVGDLVVVDAHVQELVNNGWTSDEVKKPHAQPPRRPPAEVTEE